MFRPTLLATLAVASFAQASNFNISLSAEDGRFVVAENGGGTVLAANRTQVGPWETFTLFDLNGGQLVSGDAIALRAVDGHFVSAENGGGGEVNALRDWVLGWETFRIERSDGSPAGTSLEVANVQVILRTMTGHLWSTRNGALRADSKDAVRFRVGFRSRPPRAALSAPFARPADFDGPIGFDHDRAQRTLLTACSGFWGANFPNCYDQHEGSDFMLRSGFAGQVLGNNEVLAAAGGIVIEVADGNVDTCFVAPNPGGDYQIQCPGNPKLLPNFVKVLHDDGDIAWYYHLKRGSVAVSIGQRIACGQLIGQVGSSGVSSAPHVHFQLERDGAAIDPYLVNAWAQLGGLRRRIPQRTCNVPAPPPVCTAVQQVFNCSGQPAQALCQGVTVATGGCVAWNFFGQCIQTCAQLCGTVNQTVTVACP